MFILQTHLHFGHNALSRDEQYFDEPEQYKPERWLPGVNSAQKQRLMALCVLPFGVGKRNCLGRRFAEQEMNIAIVKVKCSILFKYGTQSMLYNI